MFVKKRHTQLFLGLKFPKELVQLISDRTLSAKGAPHCRGFSDILLFYLQRQNIASKLAGWFFLTLNSRHVVASALSFFISRPAFIVALSRMLRMRGSGIRQD
jgi:hypothetical protein